MPRAATASRPSRVLDRSAGARSARARALRRAARACRRSGCASASFQAELVRTLATAMRASLRIAAMQRRAATAELSTIADVRRRNASCSLRCALLPRRPWSRRPAAQQPGRAASRRHLARRRTIRACRAICRSCGWCRDVEPRATAALRRVRAARSSSRSTAISRRRCRSCRSRCCSRARSATTPSTTKVSPNCGSAARPTRARTFRALQPARPSAISSEAAALREAECDEALGDQPAALAIYERLSTTKTTAPDDVLMRLGTAAKAAGDYEKARDGVLARLLRVSVQRPALSAGAELDAAEREPIAAGTSALQAGAGARRAAVRRQALHAGARRRSSAAQRGAGRRPRARRAPARRVRLLPEATARARDGAAAVSSTAASRQGEALFFYALALRELGDDAEYLQIDPPHRRRVPDADWAEEALEQPRRSYYIVKDERRLRRRGSFRELYASFPTGRYAERAAWKIGWRRTGTASYADTIRVFERAAADFPRSDYRPPWLYWAGRAHEALSEPALARCALQPRGDRLPELATTAVWRSRTCGTRRGAARTPARRRRDGTIGRRRAAGDASLPAVPLPPNAPLDPGAARRSTSTTRRIDELQYAQKSLGRLAGDPGDVAWIYQQQGTAETGTRQFTLYRGAINAMKRAYPQYLAAGGERPAARDAAGHLPARLLGSDSEVRRPSTTSIRTWSPRSSRRSRRSSPTSGRRPTPSA